MVEIIPFTHDYAEYLRDESRNEGSADFIAFPETEEDVRSVLRTLHADAVPITIQGMRTGLAAGAVPEGGCILNLSRMDRYLGMREEGGRFFLRMQPGVMLLDLQQRLRARNLPTQGWSNEDAHVFEAFRNADALTFPTDPTETSASLGGMASCNASGAKSYRYGAMRPHISALRMALPDGDMLHIRRGEHFADGRTITLTTEEGRRIEAHLPSYAMPQAKCASGYYAADGMDAIDAVIGSDGTLGVITELELELLRAPDTVWDASCFLPDEATALLLVRRVRERLEHAAAVEYFDSGVLDLLRAKARCGGASSNVPEPPEDATACVSIEIACQDEDAAMAELETLVEIIEEVGGDADAAWVACTDADRETQRIFRHAAPECANALIDERRRTHPRLTKLGSDMSVPPERLEDAVALYRSTLEREGLESATWGHIGDAHLHVNILPRDEDEYARGKALLAEWAREIARMGGAVSAEHGVGKIKRDFLLPMYGEQGIREMARFKLAFDPSAQLGRGNLFNTTLLADVASESHLDV